MTSLKMIFLIIVTLMLGNHLAHALSCQTLFAKSRYEKEILLVDFEKSLLELVKTVENPHHGFFGPDSMFWKVNRERVLSLLSGSPIALQISHPSVAHAIAQRPNGIQYPIERFKATINVLVDFVFGDVPTALNTARRMHRLHSHFKGETKENGKYSANNPELMYWVWATLIDSSLQAYQRYVQPLSKEEIQQYYQESKILARLSGTPYEMIPEDYQAFRRYFDTQIKNLVVTDNAKNIFDFLMSKEGAGKYIDSEMTPLLRPVGLHILPKITASMLPKAIADQFGVSTSSNLDIFLNRIRYGVAIAPPRLRYAHGYLDAVQRISQ